MGDKRAKETAGEVVFLKNIYAISTRKLNYFLGVALIHKPEKVNEFFVLISVSFGPNLIYKLVICHTNVS